MAETRRHIPVDPGRFSQISGSAAAEKSLSGFVLVVIQSHRSSGGTTVSHDSAALGADASSRRPPLLTGPRPPRPTPTAARPATGTTRCDGNRYAYAADSPVGNTDPTGESALDNFLATLGEYTGGGAAIGTIARLRRGGSSHRYHRDRNRPGGDSPGRGCGVCGRSADRCGCRRYSRGVHRLGSRYF